MKRLIVATGTGQMLTAIAALKTLGKFNPDECIFVFAELSVAEREYSAFCKVIKSLAKQFSLRSVFIQEFQKPEEIWNELASLRVDEVWGITNWQMANRKAMNLFPEAKRVCYGDGVGLFIGETYFNPDPYWRRAITRLADTLRGTALAPALKFDEWILAVKKGFGLAVPSAASLIDREIYQSVLSVAEQALDLAKYVLPERSLVFLGCNFSESGRMTLTDEIEAYKDFFRSHATPGQQLFIKPHPRDSFAKLQILAKEMDKIFDQVNFLNDEKLTYIPF